MLRLIIDGNSCRMGLPLRARPVQAHPGESAIAPVQLDGLPGEIDALGRRWQRKLEFHMTVLGAAVIEEVVGDWERVGRALHGRDVSPIYATRELRHVHVPDKPELETLVVLVECPVLPALYGELSRELGVELAPLPSHITLYSTDPEQGVGINDEEQLRERTRELTEDEATEVRRAMRFDSVFGTET